MVRNYKRKKGARTYRDYEESELKKAFTEVRQKKLSIRKASQKYKIPFGMIQSNEPFVFESPISLLQYFRFNYTYM